jgi:hypothetical protein
LEAIVDIVDWIVLGVLYVAGSYGLSVLCYDVIFPAMAGKDEWDDN